MNISISNSDGRPIYEQIAAQIKAMIFSGELCPDDILPSMRMLARDLRVSVITTKRAYEELERDGYLYTQKGRGSFVAECDFKALHEQQVQITKTYLQKAIRSARIGTITQEQFLDLAAMLWEEDT